MKGTAYSAALVLWLVASVPAATNYVSTAGSDVPGNGTQTNPWLTIRYAVTNSATVAGDEIRVGEGTYSENITFASISTLTVVGGFNTNGWTWDPAAHPSIIKAAAPASDVVVFRARGITLKAFHVTGGKYGIWYYNNTGVEARYTVSHCTITNNTSDGIRVEQGGTKSYLTAQNCLIARNGGNGIYMNIDNAAAESYVYNCTLVDNAGYGYIDINGWQKTTTLRNCIVARNRNSGVRHSGTGHIDAILDSCVYANTNGNFSSAFSGNYLTLAVGGGVSCGYPAFVGADDYQLQDGSVCIDAGADLSGAGITDDLLGTARSGAFDLGCYESAFSAAPRYAATFADAAAGNDAAAGTNSATAKKTIGAALAVTASGGTCNVAAGTYQEDFPITTNNISLLGADWQTTVVSGSVQAVIQVLGTGFALRDLTVRGGLACGLYVGYNATANSSYIGTVEHCRFMGNAIGVLAANVNTAYHRRFGLTRCAVTNNTSHGVLISGRSSLIARNCLIADNGGWGVWDPVDNCIYRNYYLNCTIANNGGDGLWHQNNSYAGADVANTIISGNGGYGFRYDSVSYYRNATSNSCVYGHATNFLGNNHLFYGGMLSVDPIFAEGGDYHLQDGSPCVDAGVAWTHSDPLLTITNDLEGNLRSPPYDMGCYESSYAAPPTYPATYVNGTSGDDSAAGTNWATARETIGASVAITAPGGTCYVAAGTYNETVVLPANVAVEGADRDTTIITNATYAISLADTNSAVRNFTLRGGSSAGRIVGAACTVSNCLIRGHSGYGIEVYGHGSRLVDCEIIKNGHGVIGDRPPWGGASVRVIVDGCIVTNNTGNGVTGGAKGAVAAYNSLIAKNGGDGIYIGADNSGYDSFIYYCTIADNGGDGYQDNQYWHWSTHITNTIISGNGAFGVLRQTSNARSAFLGYSCVYGNVSGDFSGGQIVTGAGMITNRLPGFDVPGYQLLPTAPCLDTGIALSITNDINRLLRPQLAARPPVGSGFDMGCYEMPPWVFGSVFVIH